MAKINLDRGLYDWAEIEAQKAMDLDGRTRTLELLLAEIYIYKGEFEQAIKLLMQLHTADPNNTQIKKLLDIARRLPEESRAAIQGPAAREETVIDSSAAPVAQPDESELEMAQVLDQAMTIAGTRGALFVNHEGLVIDSRWTMNMEMARCGATIGELGNELNRSLLECSFGAVQSILVETAEPTFYVIRQKEGAFIFVADETCNLGTLRMRIEKLVVRYQPE
jgi:predicted regulator of Ras-like GTPase activity (Roadblock/LC7/MglB family)